MAIWIRTGDVTIFKVAHSETRIRINYPCGPQ